MCGIFIAISEDNEVVSIDKEKKIIKLLHHRGPDANGVVRLKNATLIHTRLSIVDVDDRSNQPLKSDDSRWFILFNGECYNFKDLREELSQKGEFFKTQSDTEVILKSFLFFGTDFIHKINGIFSIVIYDSLQKCAHVWRDRLGVKPLYWAEFQGNYFFSSEIKPLLLFTKIRVNEDAFDSYFNFRYVMGDKTFFKNIFEVSPGTYVCVSRFKRKESVYWSLEDFRPERVDKVLHTKVLSHLLKDSVKIQTDTDSRISSFLSGGIDSALVSAYASQVSKKIDTYTFSTLIKGDETQKARNISAFLNLNHVSVKDDSNAEIFKKIIFHLEDPIGDSILLPTWQLAKAASRNKIVLCGEGADEIFSGYIHQYFLSLEDRFFNLLPKNFSIFLATIFKVLPQRIIELIFPYPTALGHTGTNKVIQHLKNFKNEIERIDELLSLWREANSSNIFCDKFKRDTLRRDFWLKLEGIPFEDKLKRLDLKFWTPRYTLHRLDRLTMAHSLEARVPYFDHRLVEHMLKISGKETFSIIDPKSYFRQNIDPSILPKEVLNRRKRSFVMPIQDVFTQKTLKSFEDQLLDNSSKRGIFKKNHLEVFVKKKDKELLYYKQLQVLLNFEWWCQVYLDSDPILKV